MPNRFKSWARQFLLSIPASSWSKPNFTATLSSPSPKTLPATKPKSTKQSNLPNLSSSPNSSNGQEKAPLTFMTNSWSVAPRKFCAGNKPMLTWWLKKSLNSNRNLKTTRSETWKAKRKTKTTPLIIVTLKAIKMRKTRMTAWMKKMKIFLCDKCSKKAKKKRSNKWYCQKSKQIKFVFLIFRQCWMISELVFVFLD